MLYKSNVLTYLKLLEKHLAHSKKINVLAIVIITKNISFLA
jgi:hypothetical protein